MNTRQAAATGNRQSQPTSRLSAGGQAAAAVLVVLAVEVMADRAAAAVGTAKKLSVLRLVNWFRTALAQVELVDLIQALDLAGSAPLRRPQGH